MSECVDWAITGNPACCVSNCPEGPLPPPADIFVGAPCNIVKQYVQSSINFPSIMIGISQGGSISLSMTLQTQGTNFFYFNDWTLDLPIKFYPKKTSEEDYNLCDKGYLISRNANSFVQIFGGSWGSAPTSNSTYANAWQIYYRRGHFFSPAAQGCEDAAFLYTNPDSSPNEYPYYITLTVPEFYCIFRVVYAANEAVVSMLGGEALAYSRNSNFGFGGLFEGFGGLSYRVEFFWRVDFLNYYGINGTPMAAATMTARNSGIIGMISATAVSAVEGTDYIPLLFPDGGPNFPP